MPRRVLKQLRVLSSTGLRDVGHDCPFSPGPVPSGGEGAAVGDLSGIGLGSAWVMEAVDRKLLAGLQEAERAARRPEHRLKAGRSGVQHAWGEVVTWWRAVWPSFCPGCDPRREAHRHSPAAWLSEARSGRRSAPRCCSLPCCPGSLSVTAWRASRTCAPRRFAPGVLMAAGQAGGRQLAVVHCVGIIVSVSLAVADHRHAAVLEHGLVRWVSWRTLVIVASGFADPR
jgi:hypothetical protein